MMMELVTLVFPIVQIFRHKQAARATQAILAEFDAKKLHSEPSTTGSMATSTASKRGMFSMESLDECLTSNWDGLQVYASCMELNGENIIFLTKVLGFQRKWGMDFPKIRDSSRARMGMFRAALSIYVTLVHSDTASYPINIESQYVFPESMSPLSKQMLRLETCLRRFHSRVVTQCSLSTQTSKTDLNLASMPSCNLSLARLQSSSPPDATANRRQRQSPPSRHGMSRSRSL